VAAASIRDAAADDIPACAELAWNAGLERDPAEWRDVLRDDLTASEQHLSVAEAGGVVVGYGRAMLFLPAADGPADSAPPGYYLTGMFVRPDHRRMGVGTALTQARLAWISLHEDKAWYFANAGNLGSIELHRRLGFREVTRDFSFPGVTFDGGVGVLFRAVLRH
jgi:ribosomal protein S18 acetylase RimI-like enzyme